MWESLGGGVGHTGFLALPVAATVSAVDFTNEGHVIIGGYFQSTSDQTGPPHDDDGNGTNVTLRSDQYQHSEEISGNVPFKLIANNIAMWNGTNWSALQGGIHTFACSCCGVCLHALNANNIVSGCHRVVFFVRQRKVNDVTNSLFAYRRFAWFEYHSMSVTNRNCQRCASSGGQSNCIRKISAVSFFMFKKYV